MIVIEKDIPLPKRTNPNAGRTTQYPFSEMVPGDSFAVEVPSDVKPARVAERLRASAANWAKRHNAQLAFVTRVVDESGAARVRVWAQVKAQAQ